MIDTLLSLRPLTPSSCDICMRERVDGSRLCATCLEAIGRLVWIVRGGAEVPCCYAKAAGGAQ